jgi:hypothetical protein
MSQLFIIPISIQINPRPPTKQSKRPINRPQATIILKLLHGLLLRLAQNRTKQRKELDTLRITSEFTFRQLPNLFHVLRYHRRTVARNEDCFRVLCCECLACFRGSCLQNDGRALWTWLAEMRSRDVEVFAYMVDLSDARWVGVDPALAI